VKQAKDWPYSTFHRNVKMGIYTLNWAYGLVDENEDYGEVG
jgi:hypothetical protein